MDAEMLGPKSQIYIKTCQHGLIQITSQNKPFDSSIYHLLMSMKDLCKSTRTEQDSMSV